MADQSYDDPRMSYDDPREDRRPCVVAALSEVGEQTGNLRAQIKELSKRLDPVLRPGLTPPFDRDETQKAIEQRSPLAGQIRGHMAEIRAAQADIESLLTRLEV